MLQTFSSGQSLALNLQGQKNVQPYDSTLRFNRIVERKDNDPTATIYSIDPNAFLKALEHDRLPELFKITLAARPARNGVGIWDTLFNSAPNQGMTGCILLANNDYQPIGQNRVVITSKFLNFSMRVSRVALNQVETGDRIGIAINDIAKGLIYILLYVIEDVCTIPSPEKDDEDRPSLLSAVNVKMEHALRVNYDGSNTLVNMEEGTVYDQDKAQVFVQWLINVVGDVPSSYPFKPHFLPVNLPAVKRTELEARLQEDVARATPISYQDIEALSREAYQRAKPLKTNNPQKGNQQNGNTRRRPAARPRPGNELPIVEVVTTSEYVYLKLDDKSNPDNQIYRLDRHDVLDQSVTETFLNNKDLANVLISESNRVFELSDAVFGEGSYLRYFTLNF